MYPTLLKIKDHATQIATIGRSNFDRNSPNYRASVKKLREYFDELSDPVFVDEMKKVLSQEEETVSQMGYLKGLFQELLGVKTAFASPPVSALLITGGSGAVLPGVGGGHASSVVVLPGTGPVRVPVGNCLYEFGKKLGAKKLLAFAVPGTREFMIAEAAVYASYIIIKTGDYICREFSTCPEGTVKLDADTDILGETIHVCCPIGKEKVYKSVDGSDYTCCEKGDNECFCRSKGPNYMWFSGHKKAPVDYHHMGGLHGTQKTECVVKGMIWNVSAMQKIWYPLMQ